MDILEKYNTTLEHYNNHVYRTLNAHNTVIENKITEESLNNTGIASIHIQALTLASSVNKSNILKAAHTINSIVFEIRQTAVQYSYNPILNIETFTFSDETKLQYKDNIWT